MKIILQIENVITKYSNFLTCPNCFTWILILNFDIWRFSAASSVVNVNWTPSMRLNTSNLLFWFFFLWLSQSTKTSTIISKMEFRTNVSNTAGARPQCFISNSVHSNSYISCFSAAFNVVNVNWTSKRFDFNTVLILQTFHFDLFSLCRSQSTKTSTIIPKREFRTNVGNVAGARPRYFIFN